MKKNLTEIKHEFIVALKSYVESTTYNLLCYMSLQYDGDDNGDDDRKVVTGLGI